MIAFPSAKINLGLSIVSKRTDGFHNLETIFYPIPVRDVLEIVHSEETRFVQTGLPIPGTPDQNLILLAYSQLKNRYSDMVGPLNIYLHKAIPMGAGLGGGSSDAACALRLISRYFDLPVSLQSMNSFALNLGSDCSFFLQTAACYATGRGEILEPVKLDLSSYSFLLIHPEIRIGTAWAYAEIEPRFSEVDLKEAVQEPLENWKNILKNDFELPVFKAHPSLLAIKKKLYDAGALYASMTGSGSTLFGIFKKSAIPIIVVENASQTIII